MSFEKYRQAADFLQGKGRRLAGAALAVRPEAKGTEAIAGFVRPKAGVQRSNVPGRSVGNAAKFLTIWLSRDRRAASPFSSSLHGPRPPSLAAILKAMIGAWVAQRGRTARRDPAAGLFRGRWNGVE
jgi:hypothetical protein